MRKIVFDPKLWGGKDRGDNRHCWKPATIIEEYIVNGDHVATVKFDHDGRMSRGHFVSMMKEA